MVNIAFVLSQEQNSVPLWELIAPVRTTGDRVEFWLPGPVLESRFSDLTPDLPLLAVLGKSPVSALRSVTLSARMAASKWEAEKPPLPGGPACGEPAPGMRTGLDPGEGTDLRLSGRTDPRLGVGTGPGATSRFSREERRKTCRFLPASDELARSVAGIQLEYLQRWERGEGRKR
jgi:hypothetical protein